MRIINLCPHEIDIRLPNGDRVILQAADRPARVEVVRTSIGAVALDLEAAVAAEYGDADGDGDGIPSPEVPLLDSEYGRVVDLPQPQEGTQYVVSYPVAFACASRRDLLIPEDLVRDERGVVVACRALSRVAARSDGA